jgi:hypothetical protein
MNLKEAKVLIEKLEQKKELEERLSDFDIHWCNHCKGYFDFKFVEANFTFMERLKGKDYMYKYICSNCGKEWKSFLKDLNIHKKLIKEI